jgi:tetratricopeptide (TPR) repeat protein
VRAERVGITRSRGAVGLAVAISVLGGAWMGTGATARAADFEDAERSAGDPVAMHLERGLAYLAQGDYARAVIEFEQVLQLDYVSLDLRERAESYAEAARRYQRGERLTFSGFLETGGGYYRENTTDSTRAVGSRASEPFVLFRANGGVSYLPGNDLAYTGNLDYRYRNYDEEGRRDDRDLRWRGMVQRSLAQGSQGLGVRGRVSYRGESTYRNDYGIFANRGFVLDSDNEIVIEADVRRREYQSRLRDRSRTNADVGVTWTRAEQDGRGSLSVNVMAGYEWRRSDSPDGDATLYGMSVDYGKEISPRTSMFLFGWYEHNGYHRDRVLYDEADAPVGVKTRADDLFEFGGGLIYRFAPDWTLRPEILYILDDSNTLWGNYSSTEFWVSVRRAF